MPQDRENPPWTAAMIAKAQRGVDVLPAEVLGAFKQARGPQKTATKQPVSLRLDRDVVEHFKATGAGWQSRINETLRKAMAIG